MARIWWWLLPLVGSPLGQSTAVADDAPLAERAAALLVRRCLECHSGNDPQGQLDLTTRSALVKGGDSGPAFDAHPPSKSLLWRRVVAGEMPPKKPLMADERQLLAAWIEAGAPYAHSPLSPWQMTTPDRAGLDWWSLQPLRSIIPPVAVDLGSARTAIDAFHQQGLHNAGLAPSPPAERRVLIRRMTFDLLGLPPAPDEIADFLSEDRPDADARLVDRLLASPHYGERWARHWLDVVRFGESNGFERDLPRLNAWHYRDWVIGAFNEDLPYSEFVRRQIAGTDDEAESWKSTGFLVAGPHDTVIPVSERMRQTMRFDELEDLLGVVGQTFLGLTVNCARCHDHKFDPVPQTDYYQIAAVLAGVDHGEKDHLPNAVAAKQRSVRDRIERLTAILRDQERPLRKKILATRRKPATETPPAPIPFAAWDFTNGLNDLGGKLPATLHGGARRTNEGLVLDGQSAFAASAPLTTPLREKTLEAKVRLADRRQQGGGVMSVQTLDGGVFDAIVFGEQQSGHWMAGSNGFVRTQSFQGAAESSGPDEFVFLAIAYHADGTIAGYRNGQPYGQPYRSSGPVTFEPNQSQVVFGLRHAPAGGNRLLSGLIASVRLYDRALTADEVAASAVAGEVFVTESELLELMTETERRERRSRQQELQALQERDAELTKTGPTKIYTALLSEPKPVRFMRRGDVSQPGELMAASSLTALASSGRSFRLAYDTPERERRIALAEWLASRDNALAIRTIVNRLWHYHFATGFIETPNDLGFNGGLPQHAEWFEWLSGEFVRTGGGIKRFHRQVVGSAVYRQSSRPRAECLERDAGNRLLWRMTPRRLEAEAVRDAMLSVAGELNETLGGPSYQDFHSYFFKGTQFYDPIDIDEANVHRRTVYRMWARGGRSPFLDTFDCPDPSTTTPKRSVTTTPLQALSLMNNAFSLRMAERMAERAKLEGAANSQANIMGVYRLAYGRDPQDAEIVTAKQFVQRRGLIELCRAVLNSSEFLYVE